jgi:F-type H+-transporting ATPase subunit delta
MLGFLGVAAADPQVKLLLDSPDVADEQKAFRLAEVVGDELNERARKFVQALAANKRLELIDDVREQYEALRAAEEQTLDVEVVSAFPLTDEQSETITRSLAVKYSKEVNLTSVVDRHLLGGAVIRAGDTVIDGSVRGKLDKLAESLQRT